MKATGIIRKMDELGRLCLPRELRRTLDIEDCAPIEIFVDKDAIVLKKYNPNPNACIFCNSTKHTESFYDKPICRKCVEKLIEIVKERGMF